MKKTVPGGSVSVVRGAVVFPIARISGGGGEGVLPGFGDASKKRLSKGQEKKHGELRGLNPEHERTTSSFQKIRYRNT